MDEHGEHYPVRISSKTFGSSAEKKPLRIPRRTIVTGGLTLLGLAALGARRLGVFGGKKQESNAIAAEVPVTTPTETAPPKPNFLGELSKLIIGDSHSSDLTNTMQDNRAEILNRFGNNDIKAILTPLDAIITDTLANNPKYQQINPDILLGLIGIESQGIHPQGQFDSNDVGIYEQQPDNVKPFLMPQEHVYRYKKDEPLKADDARRDPKVATRLACEYLKWATDHYQGRFDLAVLSFYRGSGNVDRLTINNMNMPPVGMSYYDWATSKKTKDLADVAGLVDWDLNYPLLMLASAKVISEALEK